MKNIKIAGIAALAAGLLVGCANNPQGETNGASYVESSTSSVESSSSSSESSSSSTVESSVDMGDGNTDDIAVIITDNQDILKEGQTSQGDSSSNSDTSKPTSSDTHEPTSEPTTSQPTSSSSNSTPNTSKPTSSSSQPTTSKPTSSSSSSGGNTSTPTSPYWNPDAPGNKPGPYGGYYDASGTLHVLKANMPKDSEGYPLKSYTDEVGQPRLSKADKEAYDAETERIDNGGLPDTSGLDLSGWTW